MILHGFRLGYPYGPFRIRNMHLELICAVMNVRIYVGWGICSRKVTRKVITMAEFFKCPLCGHRRPVNGWFPILLDDGVIVQEVRGAGRGRGFVTVSEQDATRTLTGLNLLGMARRCLRIVGMCMKSTQVSASALLGDVPSDLEEEIVRGKAEDYGYEEKESD